MKAWILLVCGGRDFNDYEAVASVLTPLRAEHPDIFVLQGGAPGADALARHWCQRFTVPYATVDAHWTTLSKSAGPIRNEWMLRLEPMGVVAFAGGKGTADMVAKAKAAGVPVREVTP